MNDPDPKLDSDLTFVSDVLPLAIVLIESDIPLLAVNYQGRGLLAYHEPLFQIPFTAIEVGLIFWFKPLSFQFLPYLSARDALRISLHNLHDSEMDLARPAGAAFLTRGSHRA
jgi:hypothetical protein